MQQQATDFRYCLYGLKVASQLECPQLSFDAEGGEPDVRIELGEVPTTLGPGHGKGFKFEATPSELLIKTPGIGYQLITGGNRIRVQPRPDRPPEDIRMVLLGWSMGALLHQRGIVPLHAGVVAKGGGAIAFCADGGTGKSTLVAALVERGFRILDDNIAALDFSGGEPVVRPGCPEVKLFDDSVAWCHSAKKHEGPSWACGPKRGLFLEGHFEPSQQPLRAIVVMTAGPEPGVRFGRLTASEAFQEITKHVFCRRFLGAMGSSDRHFRRMVDLSNRVPAFSMDLGTPKPHPEALCDQISATLEALIAKVPLPE